jgi:t-SNARE complex subunit (syntaxin)
MAHSSRRGGRGGDQELVSVVDVDSQLTSLSKSNSKLERMLEKIGTHIDNADFRDMLTTERATAAGLTKKLLQQLKATGNKPLIRKFEREYKRFSELIGRIDTKQKQQIVAVSLKDHSHLASELQESESRMGRGASFVQAVLPSEQELVFLEYRVNEAEQRHAEIKEVERMVAEVAEIFVDLRTMVDEQQVNIDVIDANISAAKDQTETGLKELQQAEKHQRSMRKRMLCTLFILLVIIAIIIVVVLVLKKSI